MAAHTTGRAMRRHPLADRARLYSGFGIQRRHVRWRRRRRRPDQVLENPFSAKNRRSAICTGSLHQDAALPEQPTPSFEFGAERHAPKPAPVDLWNSIVTREAFVDEGIVRCEEIHHIAVLAHDA